jgi:hypothetical protein
VACEKPDPCAAIFRDSVQFDTTSVGPRSPGYDYWLWQVDLGDSAHHVTQDIDLEGRLSIAGDVLQVAASATPIDRADWLHPVWSRFEDGVKSSFYQSRALAHWTGLHEVSRGGQWNQPDMAIDSPDTHALMDQLFDADAHRHGSVFRDSRPRDGSAARRIQRKKSIAARY